MSNKKPTKTSTATLLRFHLFKNEDLDFQFIRALTYASYDGASIGESLRVVSLIKERKIATWVSAWQGEAATVEKLAEEAFTRGNRVSARKAFLRAYNYYRTAEFYASVKTPEAAGLYKSSLRCFDRAGALFDPPCESIRIPFEGVSLPGHFFYAGKRDTPGPTIIICGGADGSGEELYFLGGREAVDHGYNVLVFHGPGQRGALHENERLVFRQDYEVPLKAVVDYALSRADVDKERLALYGLSLGGYFVPRAPVMDKRIGALIANSPIMDFHLWLLRHIGINLNRIPPLLEGLVEGVAQVLLPKTQLDYVCWTYGVTRLIDYLKIIEGFQLGELPKQITCPTLCLASEGEGKESERQARKFYDMLQCPKEFHLFTVEEGADSHCQINNISLSGQFIFNWLDDVFGVKSKRAGSAL